MFSRKSWESQSCLSIRATLWWDRDPGVSDTRLSRGKLHSRSGALAISGRPYIVLNGLFRKHNNDNKSRINALEVEIIIAGNMNPTNILPIYWQAYCQELDTKIAYLW